MAYREEPLAEGDLKRELLLDMLGDLVVGGLTKLYRRLYDEALVNPEFSGDFIAVRGACTVAFTGESDTPRQVVDLLQEEIERMRREGVDPEVFMLVKNQMYGELLGDVEAVDDAAEEAAAACLKGRTLADEIAALAALTVEDANALLQTACGRKTAPTCRSIRRKNNEVKLKMVYHVQFPGLGLDLTINRVALAIGGFNIYWYGVIIAAGMLLAMLYAFRNAVDYGIDSDRLVDVVAIGTVMAIVCARIYYVAMAPFAYQSLWEMIDIRKGGIAIYGAVIGAFVFGALAAKWRKVPLLPLFDLVSLGFLIGQGIGRWGNFVNQEAFGTNTTLPGACTARARRRISNPCRSRCPRACPWTPPRRCTRRFCMRASGVWLLRRAGFVLQKTAVQRTNLPGLYHLVRPGPRLDRGAAHRLAADRQYRSARQPAGGDWVGHCGRRAYGHRSAQCQGQAAHGAAGCEGPEKAGRGRGPLHGGHPARRRTPR